MDHKLGRIGLVSWQGKPNRRFKAGIRPWTVVVVICALLGAAGAGAQALGWLPRTGPFAVVPPALILLAISAQLVAAARAIQTWFAT
jgi:hypothetical protein